MLSFSTKNLNKSFIINILTSALIVSFIAGNLVLNLNVFLLIVTSCLFYGKKIFEDKLDILDKILIILFVYILLCSFFNNISYYNDGSSKDFYVFFKSLFFLRFLILYFVVKFLVKENIINFKYFFITSFICVTFVSLDIIFQLIFGFDVFGYESPSDSRRLSGPFGEELIAGSFIQRFSLISLFLIPIFFKFKKNSNTYLFTIFFIFLYLTSLVLAGNRIPLVFFILTISGIAIFEQKLRKFLLPFIFTVFLSTFLVFNLNEFSRYHMLSFGEKIEQIVFPFSEKNLLTEEEKEKNEIHEFYTFEHQGKKYKMLNSHLKEFKTGYVTWLDKKILGGGIKSFKINCPKAKTINCSSHPHNYYLEILANLGLIGFFIILFLFIAIFFKIFIPKYFKKSHLNNFHLITPFIFLFFAEIFPIKSTGSFFSTANSTYIFLILSIIVSLAKKKIKLNR